MLTCLKCNRKPLDLGGTLKCIKCGVSAKPEDWNKFMQKDGGQSLLRQLETMERPVYALNAVLTSMILNKEQDKGLMGLVKTTLESVKQLDLESHITDAETLKEAKALLKKVKR